MRKSAMTELLIRQIDGEGPITFAKYVGMALYDPDHGYYSSGKVRFGVGGDFTTSPHVAEVFSRCICRLLIRADEALGHPDPFVFAEGGPGEGLLAEQVLSRLKFAAPGLYARLAYWPDELSPALSVRQAKRLNSFGDRILKVAPEGFSGVYLSNELVDAMPFHVISTDGCSMEEIFVAREGERLIERLGGLSDESVGRHCADVLSALAPTATQGLRWRFEVRPAADAWLERVCAKLGRGFIVTIDYGDLEEKLYGPWKPQGTARGFKEASMVEDILAEPGEADITASVNFSQLIRKGRELGLQSAETANQREFLFRLGIAEEAAKMEDEAAGEVERHAIRSSMWPLLFPGTGMGEVFKALAQGKEADPDGLWSSDR